MHRSNQKSVQIGPTKEIRLPVLFGMRRVSTIGDYCDEDDCPPNQADKNINADSAAN